MRLPNLLGWVVLLGLVVVGWFVGSLLNVAPGGGALVGGILGLAVDYLALPSNLTAS